MLDDPGSLASRDQRRASTRMAWRKTVRLMSLAQEMENMNQAAREVAPCSSWRDARTASMLPPPRLTSV